MKKFIASIVTIVLSLFTATTPVMATSPTNSALTTFGVDAAILTGCAAEEEQGGNGAGVICIVKLVINIFTVVIGIVGAIGITIAGIQYLTAGGNEEQTRKAKRRIFEIVIGFAAYAVVYLALSFLLPNFGA